MLVNINKHYSIFVLLIAIAVSACTAPSNVKKQNDTANVDSPQSVWATRKLPGLSVTVIKSLAEVSSLLDEEKLKNQGVEPDYVLVEAKLNKYINACLDSCNDYEKSQFIQYLAYTYYKAGRLEEAKDTYKKVVSYSPNISVSDEMSSVLYVAQVAHELGNMDDIKGYIDTYSSLASKKFVRTLRFIYASSLHKSKRHTEALTLVNILIDETDSNKYHAAEVYNFKSLKLSILDSLNITEGTDELRKKVNDFLPIRKVAAKYPSNAIKRKIEGYCTVQYTVLKDGTTANLRTEDCPQKVFEKAAIKAASQFLYKPKIVNGVPVDVENVRNRFTFNLGRR